MFYDKVSETFLTHPVGLTIPTTEISFCTDGFLKLIMSIGSDKYLVIKDNT